MDGSKNDAGMDLGDGTKPKPINVGIGSSVNKVAEMCVVDLASAGEVVGGMSELDSDSVEKNGCHKCRDGSLGENDCEILGDSDCEIIEDNDCEILGDDNDGEIDPKFMDYLLGNGKLDILAEQLGDNTSANGIEKNGCCNFCGVNVATNKARAALSLSKASASSSLDTATPSCSTSNYSPIVAQHSTPKLAKLSQQTSTSSGYSSFTESQFPTPPQSSGSYWDNLRQTEELSQPKAVKLTTPKRTRTPKRMGEARQDYRHRIKPRRLMFEEDEGDAWDGETKELPGSSNNNYVETAIPYRPRYTMKEKRDVDEVNRNLAVKEIEVPNLNDWTEAPKDIRNIGADSSDDDEAPTKYYVEKILDVKFRKYGKKDRTRHYLVKWLKWSERYNEWVELEDSVSETFAFVRGRKQKISELNSDMIITSVSNTRKMSSIL